MTPAETLAKHHMLMTKEHYELMESFEREHKHCRLDREKDKAHWKAGYVYQDGHVNELFVAYRKGYALGTVSGDAANRLAAAPVAIMDTQVALGLCAPTEEDFPALYALQGRRVALVDLGAALACACVDAPQIQPHSAYHAVCDALKANDRAKPPKSDWDCARHEPANV